MDVTLLMVGTQRPTAQTNGPRSTAAPGSDLYAALVGAMADGDERAATALQTATIAAMYRIVFVIVREHADVEEVLSDTYLKAWRDSASFDPRRGTVMAWLTTMARSRALDSLRARQRRERAHERAEAAALVDGTPVHMGWSAAWDVTTAVDIAERDQRLTHALDRLPVKQRAAVVMVFLESVSHTAAAHRLGVPLGTVKTRVRLGLRQLRVLLLATSGTERPT
jgi:RNA polymerase sigma-70 factor, ECF subfamily